MPPPRLIFLLDLGWLKKAGGWQQGSMWSLKAGALGTFQICQLSGSKSTREEEFMWTHKPPPLSPVQASAWSFWAPERTLLPSATPATQELQLLFSSCPTLCYQTTMLAGQAGDIFSQRLHRSKGLLLSSERERMLR